MNVPWLSLLIFVPALAGAGLMLLPRRSDALARGVALGVHGFAVGVTMLLWAGFDAAPGKFQWVERHAWVPSLGVEYHLGVDGLGFVGLLLAAVVPAFGTWLSDRAAAGRAGLYYGLMLFLQAGLFGTFTALNFFHWFLFWELGLVPAYLLVRLFGGAEAGPASFQFFVYTMVGSVALLLGFVVLRAAGGSFDFVELAEFGRSGGLVRGLAARMPPGAVAASGEGLALAVFACVLLGFAVKVPIWPFHTWLPATYAAAPAPVTMVLTGAMSKMGVYGLLRIALPIFPDQFRACQGVLVLLALATVVLPVLAAFAEKDLKRVLAYSSINHLGYCVLGLCALAPGGAGAVWLDGTAAPVLNGVLLQMLNHGITAATLFACVELFERRSGGLRDLERFGGLRRVAPVFCGLMGISVFASIGLPGLNGFVGEYLIFQGVFASVPWVAAVATLGLLGTAIFLLSTMAKLFHGALDPDWRGFPDVTIRERWTLGVPVGLMFVLGIWPDLILRFTNPVAVGWAGGL